MTTRRHIPSAGSVRAASPIRRDADETPRALSLLTVLALLLFILGCGGIRSPGTTASEDSSRTHASDESDRVVTVSTDTASGRSGGSDSSTGSVRTQRPTESAQRQEQASPQRETRTHGGEQPVAEAEPYASGGGGLADRSSTSTRGSVGQPISQDLDDVEVGGALTTARPSVRSSAGERDGNSRRADRRQQRRQPEETRPSRDPQPPTMPEPPRVAEPFEPGGEGLPTDGTDESTDGEESTDEEEPQGTNIAFAGAQDFGYFRRLLDQGIVPRPGDLDASGFFAEHHTPLPSPSCGERVCMHPMLAVMGDLVTGDSSTVLQVGLNSPVTIHEDDRPPLNLVVVLDVSGSMQDDGKLDYLKEGLALLIEGMQDADKLAIISYSDSVALEHPMGYVGDARDSLSEVAQRLRPVGGTNLHAGLEAGFQAINAAYDSGRQNRVILLSDGQPTVGVVDPDQITAMSAAYNREGVGLTTIGLGTSFNVGLMRTLAEQGDGNFYFVEDAGAVKEVFTEELAYFTLPVAYDLEVTIEASAGYELRRAHGSSSFEMQGNGGRLALPSVFLAHRMAHDDVTASGGRRGGGSALLLELAPSSNAQARVHSNDIATVTLRFREPGTDRVKTQHAVVQSPFAMSSAPREGYFDAPDTGIIKKSFLMLNIYRALEVACREFHSGNGGSAIATLRRIQAAAEDYRGGLNDGEGDVDIDYDLELVAELEDVIRRNGAQVPQAMSIPRDPWPAN